MLSSPQAAWVRPPDGQMLAARWLLALAAVGIPVSLIWDYSWESTVGVDQTWSPPHLATHFAVWVLGLTGLKQLIAATLGGAVK